MQYKIKVQGNVETVVLLSKGAKGPVDLCSARDRSGTELIKVMTGIRRCGKSVMLELIHPQVAPAPQELQDKHYFRKHGANAYYGQN